MRARTRCSGIRSGTVEAEVSLDEVRTFETSRGNTRYVVRDTDGNEYTTFREAIGERARQLQGQRVRIEFHENQRGQYTNVYLDKVEPAPAEDSGRRRHRRRRGCLANGGRGGALARRGIGASGGGSPGSALREAEAVQGAGRRGHSRIRGGRARLSSSRRGRSACGPHALVRHETAHRTRLADSSCSPMPAAAGADPFTAPGNKILWGGQGGYSAGVDRRLHEAVGQASGGVQLLHLLAGVALRHALAVVPARRCRAHALARDAVGVDRRHGPLAARSCPRRRRRLPDRAWPAARRGKAGSPTCGRCPR